MFLIILALLLSWLPLPAPAANILCIAARCGSKLFACQKNANCRAQLTCSSRCNSKNAEERQACLIRCAEQDSSPPFDALTMCMASKGCLDQAPSPQTCAKPKAASKLADMELFDLIGTWYVVRGLSRAYDCWPCQKMQFTGVSDELLRYDYSFVAAPPRTSHIACQARRHPMSRVDARSGHFLIDYSTHGLHGSDDWYVLSRPSEDVALVYYCGSSATDSYRGGIVMARTAQPVITANMERQMNEALTAAGLGASLSLGDFCHPTVDQCSQ